MYDGWAGKFRFFKKISINRMYTTCLQKRNLQKNTAFSRISPDLFPSTCTSNKWKQLVFRVGPTVSNIKSHKQLLSYIRIHLGDELLAWIYIASEWWKWRRSILVVCNPLLRSTVHDNRTIREWFPISQVFTLHFQ